MEFSQLISIQVLFQSICIGIIVNMLKMFIEDKYPLLAENRKYKNIVIPTLAIALGIVLAMVSSIAPPWLTGGGYVDRVMYGVYIGFSSSFIFRTVKNLLIKESGGSE